ncbi:Aminotransferase-like [Abeliophyllum distichum]|uniref:Aminotransferase-like n=1 Tax=Abeliophyllum distichum TaxID=126358 RepID=A0ABD1RTW3_9LAMI
MLVYIHGLSQISIFVLRRKHMVGHGPTGELFDRARILELLEFTLDIPAFDPTLFCIAMCFWASDYNTLVFPLGPMSITLRDVSALTNLPPIGATISPAMIITHTHPSIDKQCFGSYKQLLTLR